jgi:hypothetical protein
VNDGPDDADVTGGDLTTTADTAQDDAAPAADALAMLMSWLVPVAPLPTADASAGPALTGSAELAATTVPVATATASTSVASSITDPSGPAAPQGDTVPVTASTATEVGADRTASLAAGAAAATAGTVTATDGAASTQFSTMLTRAAVATTGAVALPDGMTPTPDGPPMAWAADAATPADTTDAATAQATGTAATDLASLAADFGAQIVTTTGPTASADARADDAQAPTTGSTAQAAGAGSAAGVQLPGQAVAAAGAAGQGTSATLAEALEAGPEAVAVSRPATDAPIEFTGMLAATGTGNSMPTQATASVQASAATAPPLTTQIVDGAMLAARRIGQSVEMILQPEGLGAVTLRVTLERGGLGVHLAVENPQARELVQASWPQLQQALEQRGLAVQSMMLDLSSGRGGDGFQTFQQFSGQQARRGSNNGDRRDSPALATSDERPHIQTRAGTSLRVEYRI